MTPLAPALPLGLIPRVQAQAAARAVLERLAREAVCQGWLHGQAVKLLGTASCAGDQVPTPMATDLSAFVPFLPS